MKIFNKFKSLALLLPVLAMLSSCEEHADYTASEFVSGPQVFFNNSNARKVNVTDVDNAFDIQLNRVDSTQAGQYELKLVAEEGVLELITIPAVVEFKANSGSAVLSCTANTAEMEYDKEYKITISINEGENTSYGIADLTLTVVRPAPWKSLGKGGFADNFLGEEEGDYKEVEIQQNELEPNRFRVVEPYAEILEDLKTDQYFEFVIMPEGTEFQGLTLDAEYVLYNDYSTGKWNSNYDEEIYLLHPYRFGRTPDMWNYNVVLDYQENGLPGEVSIAPIYYLFNEGGGWDNSSATTISILFPGYVKGDYTATLDYAGIYTDKDGNVFAAGMLELGPDATDVKAVVLPADADAAAVADAIAAGELEGTEVKAGRIEVPFSAEELGGNNFQIIVVVLSDGSVKTVATTSFEYYGGGKNPWTSLGTGIFTDDIFAPLWSLTAPTYEVEILEHSENPGLYRLVDPFSNSVHPAAPLFNEQLGKYLAADGFYLEVNATDPEGVYIQLQSLGFDLGYGEYSFVSEGARYLAKYELEFLKGYGYMGKVIEGVIKFPALPFTSSDGSEGIYQGILYEGTSGYYAGMNGKIEIVLPGSNAFARSMAEAKANTTKRNISKSSFAGIKADKKLKKLYNLQATKFGAPNF